MTEPSHTLHNTFDDEVAQHALQNLTLLIGPRPGKKSFATLDALKLTHCCTLLSTREDAQSIKKICGRLGCDWIWLPIEGGKLETLRQTDVAGHVRQLVEQVGDEPAPRIYVHCSAGIHRTGFFVYLLLRLRGLDKDAARAELVNIRPVTAEQVGEERLALADEILEADAPN